MYYTLRSILVFNTQLKTVFCATYRFVFYFTGTMQNHINAHWNNSLNHEEIENLESWKTGHNQTQREYPKNYPNTDLHTGTFWFWSIVYLSNKCDGGHGGLFVFLCRPYIRMIWKRKLVPSRHVHFSL